MGVIEHHWSTSGFDVAQERSRARKSRTVNIATVPAHRSRREVIQERQADQLAANRAEARGRCDARSGDCILLAKAALQAAIRNELDILELLPPAGSTPWRSVEEKPAKPRKLMRQLETIIRP